MRTKRTVSSRRKHSLKVKSGGGIFTKGIKSSTEASLVLSCPEFDDLATKLSTNGDAFIKGNVYFEKYSDKTPKVFMDELTVKLLRGRKVYFLAYFSFNEPSATNIMDQYMFMCSLASYGIDELNIVLPYFPTGTMERIVGEGELGTGYYLAHLLNSIPCGAYKNVLYVMDMHALCSRFFFHTNIRTVFITMMPKYLDIIETKKHNTSQSASDATKSASAIISDVLEKVVSTTAALAEPVKFIVFPDDGAEKRNKELCKNHVDFITCSKKRSGDDRTIEITGNIDNLKKAIRDEKPVEFYIVDDLVQTGGTLGETAKKLVETLHIEFSSTDNIKKSTLKHIETKCKKQEAFNQPADEPVPQPADNPAILKKITDAIKEHYSKQLDPQGIIQQIIDEVIKTVTASLQSAIANPEAIKKIIDAAKEAEKKQTEETMKHKQLRAEIDTVDKTKICSSTLKKCIIEKATREKEAAEIENKKKEAAILKEIIESCKFYIDMCLAAEKPQTYKLSFVIHYVVTHSILPKTDPVKEIINNVLFFQEYAEIDKMVAFKYTTTNSRPNVAKTLSIKPEVKPENVPGQPEAKPVKESVEPNQKTGIIINDIKTGKIEILPIVDVLLDVFTNVDSQYIAPYIIPSMLTAE
jgi:phosphoribosylpyrophosphate synthetase